MFRLLEPGLPKDEIFLPDFKSLGYFINKDDEIRQIKNPRSYFNYFLTKSDRYNDGRREAMNSAIRKEVHSRLIALGLNTIRLPLGAEEAERNVPIYVSDDICKKKRVIILFYEHSEDLGIFAYRIVGGKGGIDQGSAVNFVKYIQSLPSGPDNSEHPGIILANMGQLLWYRRGKRAVTWRTWNSLPQLNAVSGPLTMDPAKNRVPGNTSPAEHVEYVFNHVVKGLLDPTSVLDIIGVSDATNEVVHFLDQPKNWKTFGHRLNALALVAPYYLLTDLTNPEFTTWLRKRGRAYPFSRMAGYQAIGGPEGGPSCVGYGCNAYNLGGEFYIEVLLPLHYRFIVDWLQKVAEDPLYENEELYFLDEKEENEENEEKDISPVQTNEGDVRTAAKATMAREVTVADLSDQDAALVADTLENLGDGDNTGGVERKVSVDE